MFGFKKIVATLVALGALAVPSLALADNHTPGAARPGEHTSVQHRDSRDRRGDWRRDHDGRDRHDRDGRGWRDGRGGRGGREGRGGHGGHCR